MKTLNKQTNGEMRRKENALAKRATEGAKTSAYPCKRTHAGAHGERESFKKESGDQSPF